MLGSAELVLLWIGEWLRKAIVLCMSGRSCRWLPVKAVASVVFILLTLSLSIVLQTGRLCLSKLDKAVSLY